jgi:YHS domain-containing protein
MTHFNLEKMWLFKVMILWLISNKEKPLRQERNSATYEGVVYYFSMPGNKEYLKNPSKFEPSMEVGVLCNGRL